MAKQDKQSTMPTEETENKELQAQNERNSAIVAQQQEYMDAFGDDEPVSAKDIIIPRILLLNPTSEMVTEGDGAFGEFRDSLTGRKIGDFKTNFKFHPFFIKKLFVEYDATDPDEKKFLRVVPITHKNESLPYEDSEITAEGKKIPVSRDYTLNFYGLLSEEIEKGGAEIPYILTFRRSSLREGQKLYTMMKVTNKSARLPAAAFIITIAAEKTGNQKSTWAIPKVLIDPENITRASLPRQGVALGSPEDRSQLGAAARWFAMVNTAGATREDDDALINAKEVKSEAAPVSSDSGPAKF